MFDITLTKQNIFLFYCNILDRRYPKKENDPPLRLLDDLFRKTKATPCIYWLPLTPEQVIIYNEFYLGCSLLILTLK